MAETLRQPCRETTEIATGRLIHAGVLTLIPLYLHVHSQLIDVSQFFLFEFSGYILSSFLVTIFVNYFLLFLHIFIYIN